MSDPHWSQIFKDLATGVGLLGTAAWAVWRWGFSERIRRRREIPHVEIALAARIHAEAEKLCIASLSLEWHNSGVEPISASSRIDGYLLKDAPWDSPFLPDLLRPSFSKDVEGERTFGPGARGTIDEFLVLEPRRLYFFVWWINAESDRPIRRKILFYSRFEGRK